MAAADSWYNLLIARFALGLAVGAKSSTTPVYAAECAPTAIRKLSPSEHSCTFCLQSLRATIQYSNIAFHWRLNHS